MHFHDVELVDFVVMPNHVHGILIIQKPVNVIIGEDESFGRIQDYIENNPKNWNKDKFYQWP